MFGFSDEHRAERALDARRRSGSRAGRITRSVTGAFVAAIVGMALVVAPVWACSGPGSSIDEVRSASRLIVLADVLGSHGNGLGYDLRIIDVARGEVTPGTTITVGPPVGGTAAGYPDCWLSLPVGTRVILALTDATSLEGLSSFAWWEVGGRVSSPSAVDEWPGSLASLFAEFALPATDTESKPVEGSSDVPAWPLITLAATGIAAAWLRRRGGHDVE